MLQHFFFFQDFSSVDEGSSTATPKSPLAPSLKRLDAISSTPNSCNWPETMTIPVKFSRVC